MRANSPQHRVLPRPAGARCEHYMRPGECVVAKCPNYDGAGPVFVDERPVPSSVPYTPVSNPNDPRAKTGRTARILALISEQWGPVDLGGRGVERSRDRSVLMGLVERGVVERRQSEDCSWLYRLARARRTA